jgi:hypothetical protein
MPQKIAVAAENLATLDLVIAAKKAGTRDIDEVLENIIIIIIDGVPVNRITGRQIIGCFGIGGFQQTALYEKIAGSVKEALNEASVDELLEVRNNYEITKK